MSRRLIIAGAAVFSLLIAACLFFRIYGPQDLRTYVAMASEGHPVWRELALRRIRAGHPVDDLLKRYPPSSRSEFGPYGVYDYYQDSEPGLYFTGVTVVARDGKLIQATAWSCTWNSVFFDVPDPSLESQYHEYIEERYRKLEHTGERLPEEAN
ncbi:hypothetical protein SH661x_000146 [Planctomicrobium sp. SH661]|uniref:hypothetical protein n=1 Tax=Planctomicrobium sp. SH661 TaxID=3448124 RepID=UPI003F5BD7AD